MRTRELITALLLVVLAWRPAEAGTVTKIRDTGPDENRLVIALVAEGYLEEDEAQFVADAEQALAGLLADSPYREYAAWVNAYADFVPSNERGADKPEPCYGAPVMRDTAFDATYCSRGIQRLLTVNSGAVFSLINVDVPTWDVAAVIVNDPEYGGAGGGLLTFSVNPGAMIELFLHEAGHTFGRLADEYVSYSDPYPGGEPGEPNVTIDTERDTTKWAVWIDDATPLPTPRSFGWDPGLYEGGRYYPTGIYRPVDNCKMRSLDRAFCPICKESHVQEIHARVSAIDAVDPAEGPIELAPCEPTRFALELLPVDPPTLQVEWRLDGVPLPGESGEELLFDPAWLAEPGAFLSAHVFDATELVRRYYRDPLTAEASWTLTGAVFSDLDGDGLADACDPDADGDGTLNDDDCAPLDASVDAPARAIAHLDVRRWGDAADVSWEDLLSVESRPGGSYALMSGSLAELREDAGFDRACRWPGEASPARLDERELPGTPWAAWWYLASVEDDCGAGALQPGGGADPSPRDGLEPGALPSCP